MTHGLPDNSRGSYDSATGKFTVPVHGRYQFQLFLATYTGNGDYSIALRVDGVSFDVMCGTYAMGTSAHEDSRSLISEIELDQGQVVDFYVQTATDGMTGDHSVFPYGVQTGRSFIQGQLIKRLFPNIQSVF